MEPTKPNGLDQEELGGEFFHPAEPSTGTDDIDLDEYRAGKPHNLVEVSSLPKIQRIELRAPRKLEWFRCYAFAMERVWLYRGAGINKYYIVKSEVAEELRHVMIEAYLALCVNNHERLFLWPIKINSDSGQEFTEMNLEHVAQARDIWIRRFWDDPAGTFHVDTHDLEERKPRWPEKVDMKALVSRAFGDRRIRSLDHPCLKFDRIR